MTDDNLKIVADSSGGKPSASLGATIKIDVNGTEQYIRVDLTDYGDTLEEAINKVKKLFQNLLKDNIKAVTDVLNSVQNAGSSPSSQAPVQGQNPLEKVPEDITSPTELLKALNIPKNSTYREKVNAYHVARANNRITYRQFEILRQYFKEKPSSKGSGA
ncbi:MAG: hypothetical protein ACP5T9_05295 [Thermoplasmata archaeon]